MITELTDETFELFAAKHYDNPQCISYEEFVSDIKRFQYIQKLFARYIRSGELKVDLIFNHLIVLYNCFNGATTNMLFMKIKDDHHSLLKPFVVAMNRMPEQISYNGKAKLNKHIDEDGNVKRKVNTHVSKMR